MYVLNTKNSFPRTINDLKNYIIFSKVLYKFIKLLYIKLLIEIIKNMKDFIL